MNRRAYLFCSGLLVFVFLLAGCTTGEPNMEGVGLQAWIDAPLDETHLPLAPYEVVVHGAAPGGVQELVLSIDGRAVPDLALEDAGQKLVTGIYNWIPEAPGEYRFETRSQDSSGNWSTAANAVVYIENERDASPSISETPALQGEVALPVATETLTPTPCLAMAAFIMDGNCRKGPSTGYSAVTSLDEGTSAAVEGRNQDSSWWWIALPDSTAHCWVSDVVVETSCLPEDLQWIVAEPLLGTPELSTNTFYWGDSQPHTVTIKINAGGESPVTGVSISFRVSDENWKTLPMTNNGNDVWSISIDAHDDVPGSTDYSNTTFKYYFVAGNQFGLSVQSPTYSDIKLKNH
ncbi:MAG: hypothetical protein JXA25_09105 [Anaerolineales bacterium]|nr:hypothetical protein [Anaerolineales bacterium]